METNVLVTPEETKKEDLTEIERKMKLTGTVVKTTLAGAVVDVGLEVPGVVHISQLQSEPVNRVEDVVQPGQSVEVWVRRVVPKKKRLELTMIEPLDLEWRELSKDLVVKGKVTRLENFGAFVDIGAERPGLVHISEMTHDYIKSPSEVVKEGDEVEVKILSTNRQKKQIKLSMKALELPPVKQAQQIASSEAEAKNEPVPTAMEVAMREAMDRSKDQPDEEPETKVKATKAKSTGEIENILSRTLDQKVKTN